MNAATPNATARANVRRHLDAGRFADAMRAIFGDATVDVWEAHLRG